MTTLIECIPNVSEGRRPEVVEAVRNAAISAGPGVLLLDWTSDADHNRSVLTFLGDGPGLLRAMEAMVDEALRHVDLTKHEGEHPRLGAVDVIRAKSELCSGLPGTTAAAPSRSAVAASRRSSRRSASRVLGSGPWQ